MASGAMVIRLPDFFRFISVRGMCKQSGLLRERHVAEHLTKLLTTSQSTRGDVNVPNSKLERIEQNGTIVMKRLKMVSSGRKLTVRWQVSDNVTTG